MLRKSWLLLSAICVLCLRCASVPDVPFCAEINPWKARCTHTISGDKDFVWDDDHKHNGETWWEARPKMIIVPVKESWNPIRGYIIKNCKQFNQCSDKDISSWDRKVDTITGPVK